MIMTIRALELSDCDRVLEWRNSERVRSVSVVETEIPADDHDRWFHRVLETRPDQFLILEVRGEAFGIARIDAVAGSDDVFTWSCNSGEAALTPGVGAALPVIAIALGMERFKARRMDADVLSNNKNMLGVHRRLKIPLEGVRRAHLTRGDGTLLDVHEFGLLREEWPDVLATAVKSLPSAVSESLTAITEELRR